MVRPRLPQPPLHTSVSSIGRSGLSPKEHVAWRFCSKRRCRIYRGGPVWKADRGQNVEEKRRGSVPSSLAVLVVLGFLILDNYRQTEVTSRIGPGYQIPRIESLRRIVMSRFTRGLVVSLVVLVLGSFVVTSVPVTVVNSPLPSTGIARAADTRCYTVASLQGTYSVVATYDANVAIALALRQFDGKGNLTGTFTLNAPDPTSSTDRKITTGTQAGTYTVNCDGT